DGFPSLFLYCKRCNMISSFILIGIKCSFTKLRMIGKTFFIKGTKDGANFYSIFILYRNTFVFRENEDIFKYICLFHFYHPNCLPVYIIPLFPSFLCKRFMT